MMFKEPQGLEKPSDVSFSTFTTWIQCHNLPLFCMNPGMVRKIAEYVGKVEEIDIGDGGNCLGQFVRATDVNKPLQRCVSITTGDGQDKHIILIRYERLPEFCSTCGRVGHDVRHCIDAAVDKSKRAFGVWLKATRTMDSRRGRGESQRPRGMHNMANSMTRTSDSQVNRDRIEGGLVVRKEGEGEGGEGGSGEGNGKSDLGGGRKEVVIQQLLVEGDTEGDDIREEEEVSWMGTEFMEESLGGKMQNEGNMEVEQQSPKKRQKVEGKEWKRRAREGKSNTTGSIGEGSSGVEKKDRKMKGGRDQDPEILLPKTKSSRVDLEKGYIGESTAEAVSQPRRSP